MLTLQELQAQVDELARKIGAPAEFFPTFGTSRHDGTPHIEIDSNTYYYLAYERDTVVVRHKTTRLPRLLYWIFEGITFQMGLAYARLHKDPQIIPNSIAYQHQLELLETLHMQWRELREQEHAEILERQAYQDDLLQSKAKIDWKEWLSNRGNKRYTEE
ncbi:MAG: Imm63 family immunity protein [Chloroflexota bacterium]